jgi:hypothetical protein
MEGKLQDLFPEIKLIKDEDLRAKILEMLRDL